MQLRDFLGCEDIKARLRSEPGQFPHAVLLQGEEGCGKRTMARWIAAAAVCTDSARRPCGVCRACLRVLEDGHPDVQMLSGTGKTGALLVDQIRALRQDALRPPLEAAVKVYILPEAQKMVEQAQNALLKILEEPPAYVRFVLTAPAKDQLLDTIVSRVQVFTLQAPPPSESAAWVQKYMPQADPQTVQALAQQYNGCIGRMLAALQSEQEDPALASACTVLQALLQPDENPLLAALAGFSRDRVQFAAVMDRTGQILRDACMLRTGASVSAGSAPDTAALLAERLPQKRLLQLFEDTRYLADAALRNANMTLLATAACARLRTAAGQ